MWHASSTTIFEKPGTPPEVVNLSGFFWERLRSPELRVLFDIGVGNAKDKT